MWFTVEDRYLRLPTLTMLKVLHLAEKESNLCDVHVGLPTYLSTSVNRVISYHLKRKCMLVCRRHPHYCSRLIVPMLSIFFIRVFSPLTVHLLSENTLHKRIAPYVIRHRYQRTFIHQFNNFSVCMYMSATYLASTYVCMCVCLSVRR